jgi:hypothetical protein
MQRFMAGYSATMRVAIFVALLCLSAPAVAGKNFYWELELSKCHIYRVGDHSWELCAISKPAGQKGDKARSFSLTVRDPQQLDTQDRSPAALQKAKHKLIAEQALTAQPGEYLDYEMVTPLDLDDNHWLIQLAWVKGTPEDYDEARSALWVFNGRNAKFEKAWDSPVCAPKCKGQTIQMRSKAREVGKQVFLQQRVDATNTKTYELKWDGFKLTPVGPR